MSGTNQANTYLMRPPPPPAGPRPRRPPTSFVSSLTRDVFLEICDYIQDPVDQVSLALVDREDMEFVTNKIVPSNQRLSSRDIHPLGFCVLNEIIRQAPPPYGHRIRTQDYTLNGPSHHERLMQRLWGWMGRDMIFCGRQRHTNYVSVDTVAENDGHECCDCGASLTLRKSALMTAGQLQESQYRTVPLREKVLVESLEYHKKYNAALKVIYEQENNWIEKRQERLSWKYRGRGHAPGSLFGRDIVNGDLTMRDPEE